MIEHSSSRQQMRITLFMFERGATWPSFYTFEKSKAKEIWTLDMKYHVKLKKNLEKRGAHHLEKRRVCQEDPSNKKIKVCE